MAWILLRPSNYKQVAPLVRTGGSRHTGLAALPHRNIQQAFMATYRKAEAVVEQYNRDLAAWERQVREKQKPAQKEQAKPPRRESVLKRLRQLQAEGRRQKPKPKTHDRER